MKFFIPFLILFTLTLNASNKDYWLELAHQKNYIKLDNELTALQNSFLQDISKEKELLYALKSFENSDPKLEPLLNEWVKKFPNSIYAHTALGIYNFHIAFLSRGTRVIKNTSNRQISKMKSYFRKAHDEFYFSINKDQNFTIPIAYQLKMAMTKSNDTERKQILEKALKVNPYSYVIRYNNLNSLHPKWGGSFKKLDDFMQETIKLYQHNKLLKEQEGYYDYVKADNLKLKTNFDKKLQLKHINKAIAKNSKNSLYYLTRGNSYYYYFKQYQKALNNYNKALELNPQNIYILEMKSKTFSILKQYDLALKTINQALKYDKLNPSLLKVRASLYYKTNREQAFQDYTNALIYEPNSSSLYTKLGYIYYLNKNYSLASKSLLEANLIKPIDAKDWYYVTASQWHERDCNFVTSAYTFKDLCKNSNECSKKNIDWAIKSADFAIASNTCSQTYKK